MIPRYIKNEILVSFVKPNTVVDANTSVLDIHTGGKNSNLIGVADYQVHEKGNIKTGCLKSYFC